MYRMNEKVTLHLLIQIKIMKKTTTLFLMLLGVFYVTGQQTNQEEIDSLATFQFLE